MPRAATLVGAALAAALVAGTGTAYAGPAAAAGPVTAAPASTADGAAATLAPADGSHLEGIEKIAAEPTVADDSVESLAIDGDPLDDLTMTTGTSLLMYDVGTNSTEARYHNWVEINGEHTIELPDAVDERVTLEVPNDELVQGTNTITFYAGTFNASCGENHDDFVLSDIGLVLLGEVADGEENEFSYRFGDGSCGSNSSLLLEAELTFNITGDPRRTTGLATDFDTRQLSNGEHEITATTASGATTTHRVTVNNAPAGAPRLLPVDGTLTNGIQPVFGFTPADGDGSVTSLQVDGAAPAVTETLAPGTATIAFDVGSNSIETRYYNHLLVNGHRMEIGGDWVSERVELSVPNHFLVPGDNVIKLVVGDINGTRNGQRCANLDDFNIADVVLTPASGTATPTDVESSYAFGDGYCGSNTSRLAEAEMDFTIADAATTAARPTLGGGDAVLSMYIGGNGAEARFGNLVSINGMELEIGDVVGETVDLTFPNEWLHPGTNTVEILAGPLASSCGDNYDDFPVSDLELAPASGDATIAFKQTRASGSYYPIAIGDGLCGSSHHSTRAASVPFVVDAPAGGLRADVDTAQLPDGNHTLAATSNTGATATRLLITDNTAPEITSSTPGEGQVLKQGVVFDAVVEDASGLVGDPEFLLDDEPLSRGDLVGPGLAAGDHTIAVALTDSLGNTADRTITFSSVGIPEVPTELTPDNGTEVKPGRIDLAARVSAPDGGAVTATFSQADVVGPNAGFTGTSPQVPTTLGVAGESGVDVSGLAPLDEVSVDAPSTGDVTFQRFEIPVPAHQDRPVLRWRGTIDPQRVATLRVWDRAKEEWVALASSRGEFEGPTQLSAAVAPRHVDGDVVHVMVTGEDPFADDMEPRNPGGFADPSAYDFSLVHFTDTQYLAEGAVEQETAAERAIWKRAYGDITRWITDNAQQRKIAHVMHTGDIIENNYHPPTTPEMEQQVAGEFEVVSELHGILDEAGIPSQVIAGNHDNQLGRETGPDATYNSYFGPERYNSADDQWSGAEYGGPWREGDNQNNYVLFSAGGLDFVVVGLSYGVTTEEADWADGILKQYADRNAIVLTHDYLTPSSSVDGRGGSLAPDGSLLYKKLVEANPNVFLIMAGHRHGVGTNVKPEVGEVGNGVIELLADYQFYTVSADRLGLTEIGGHQPTDQLRFGASYLRMLQIDVERSEMIVDTYSPFLDDFGATEYDTEGRYDGTEDDMVLPVDLTSRSTSFSTDAVSLLVPVAEIGTDTVASGEVASVRWKGVGGGTTYGWIVSAASSAGGRAVAEPAVFRTAGETEVDLELVEDTVEVADDMTVEIKVVTAGEPVDHGTVELRDGDAVLGSGDVRDGIAAVVLDAPLEPGTHRLVVAFSGTAALPAAEATITLTVGEPEPEPEPGAESSSGTEPEPSATAGAESTPEADSSTEPAPGPAEVGTPPEDSAVD